MLSIYEVNDTYSAQITSTITESLKRTLTRNRRQHLYRMAILDLKTGFCLNTTQIYSSVFNSKFKLTTLQVICS